MLLWLIFSLFCFCLLQLGRKIKHLLVVFAYLCVPNVIRFFGEDLLFIIFSLNITFCNLFQALSLIQPFL